MLDSGEKLSKISNLEKIFFPLQSPQCKCDLVQDCVSCMVKNTTCDASLNCSMHEYYTTNATITNGCSVFIDRCEYVFNITGDPLQKDEQLTLLYKPTFSEFQILTL